LETGIVREMRLVKLDLARGIEEKKADLEG